MKYLYSLVIEACSDEVEFREDTHSFMTILREADWSKRRGNRWVVV